MNKYENWVEWHLIDSISVFLCCLLMVEFIMVVVLVIAFLFLFVIFGNWSCYMLNFYEMVIEFDVLSSYHVQKGVKEGRGKKTEKEEAMMVIKIHI